MVRLRKLSEGTLIHIFCHVVLVSVHTMSKERGRIHF